MITAALAACAISVAPITLDAVISMESGWNSIALHVNGLKKPLRPANRELAIAMARQYIMDGYSVDVGLMQVNSRNLKNLGIEVADAFNPCTNIKIGAKLLVSSYQKALQRTQDEQAALKIALSYYNTGSPDRGFSNGYVQRYYNSKNIKDNRNIFLYKNKDHNQYNIAKNIKYNNIYYSDTEVKISNDYFSLGDLKE